MQQRSLASSLRRVNKKPAAAAAKRRIKKPTTTSPAAAWLKMLPLSTSPPLLMPLLLLLLGIAAFSLDSCSCYAGKFCLLHVAPTPPLAHCMHTFLLPLIFCLSCCFFIFSFNFFSPSFLVFCVCLKNMYKTNSPWEFVGGSKRSRKLGKTGRHSVGERGAQIVVGVGVARVLVLA